MDDHDEIDDGYHADKSRNDLDSTNDNLDDSCEAKPESPKTKLVDLKASGFFRKEHDNNAGTIENHVSQLVQPDQQLAFHKVVALELKDYDVSYEVISRQSRAKSRKSPRGKCSSEQKLVKGKLSSGIYVQIPVIIKETCEFILKHVTCEGIFRKSGSSARINAINKRFSNPTNDNTPEYFTDCDTVYDVSSVFKQYFRQLPTPLIPYELHSTFLRCLQAKSDEHQIEALLLTVCLLPLPNIGILSYIMEFLNTVTMYHEQNRMCASNLSIVIGPNLMPVERTVGNAKAKEISPCEERVKLRSHLKVIELLIEYGNYIGYVSSKLEKSFETQLTLRGSEEDFDHYGRRKKRRSGSLTRVFGFLKKVGKTETPASPEKFSTPGMAFSHTPIIRSDARSTHKSVDRFMIRKKKHLLDAVRKVGLSGDYSAAAVVGTPLSGYITCPSPVCLDPSPNRLDWKNTPNGIRLKNLVTPSLLRRRNASKAAASAPAKPPKTRLGFSKGKTDVKKPELASKPPHPQMTKLRRKSSSTLSIHSMASSPRVTASRTSSSRIPKPSNLTTGNLRKNVSSKSVTSVKSTTSSGEYVELSSTAVLNDKKNDAFIATTSMSCLNDSPSTVSNKDPTFKSESVLPHQSNKGIDTPDTGKNFLRLTPLIKEINSLTRSAQELGEESRNEKTGQSNTHQLNKTFTPPTPIEKVEEKFRRAMKESRLIEIKSELINGNSSARTTSKNSDRRLPSHDGIGFSPSQRKIRSNLRKSDRTPKVTPNVSTPRFMSMRTPRDSARLKAAKITPSPTPQLGRSPNRCTLKRGRPNTMKSGLARPSPVRSCNSAQRVKKCRRVLQSNTPESSNAVSLTPCNNPRSTGKLTDSSNKMSNMSGGTLKRTESGKENKVPMRRRSSVQELVKIMETSSKTSSSKLPILDTPTTVIDAQKEVFRKKCDNRVVSPESPEWTSSLPRRRSLRIPKQTTRTDGPKDGHTFALPQGHKTKYEKTSAPKTCPGRNRPVKRLMEKVDISSEEWVPGTAFNFDLMSRFKEQHRQHRDRDSIHVLKTLNAGKVSANVKLFDGMNSKKSPGRSLIPRYTALHSKSSGIGLAGCNAQPSK